MTDLRNQTNTGKKFVKALYDNGYMLAEGACFHSFHIIDENLVKQVKVSLQKRYETDCETKNLP